MATDTRSQRRITRGWVGACLVAALSVTARAHDLSQSVSDVMVVGDREARVVLNVDGLELGGLDADGDARISFGELERSIEDVFERARGHFLVHAADAPVRTTLEHYAVVDDHAVRLEIRYSFDEPITALTVTSRLDRVTHPAHRHLTNVRAFGADHQAVLGGSAPTATFTPERRPLLGTVSEFLRLGLEHIVTGYDHLAFLAGLVLVSASLFSLVGVITFFTIAHSITLALATFDVVVLPGYWVESVIALSIGYVALESLLRDRAFKPYFVTFAFGLVHGFGFANILRDMSLPRGTRALSLFSFNVGVEIGQLAFVLLLFPLVGFLGSRGVPVRQTVSVCLIGMALYWFTQRAFIG